MRPSNPCLQRRARSKKRYVRRCLAGSVAAAALVAFGVNPTVHEAGAQDADMPGGPVLTVEQCLAEGGKVLVKPLQEAFAGEGITEEGLLRRQVTDLMCEDLLEQAPGDAPAQRLVAAQNYLQEVELVEGAMREAAPGVEQSSPAAAPEAPSQDAPQTSEGATQEQYGDGTDPADNDGPGVGPTTRQAAAISGSARKDEGASIPERLLRREAAGIRAGASPPEAAAGARCDLELEMLGRASKELYQGEFRIVPRIPNDMQRDETISVELSVSPTEELYGKLRKQYEEVAESSVAESRCVGLTERMEAVLTGGPGLDINSHQGENSSVRSIAPDAAWGWDITASAAGQHPVHLNLGQEIKLPSQESDFHWVQPAPFDGAITVRATLLQNVSSFVNLRWEWLWGLLAALAVWMWRRRKRSGQEDEEGLG